mmetsp:Transcript_13/g.16  ORF Transcript_13/g.16 Transcript_13/m.16 type:complete len:449 (-) Transcript_13:210-1556(-)
MEGDGKIVMQTLYIEELSADEVEEGEENVGLEETLESVQIQDETNDKTNEVGTSSSRRRGRKKRNRKKKSKKKEDLSEAGATDQAPGHSQKLTSAVVCEASEEGPAGRGGNTLTQVSDEYIFAFGGANRMQTHFSDLHQFSIKTSSWEKIPPSSGACPSPRSGHSMVHYEGSLLVYGGMNTDTCEIHNDLWHFEISSRTWKCMENVGGVIPVGRNSHSAALAQLTIPEVPGQETEEEGQVAMVVFGGGSPETGPMNDLQLLFLKPGLGDVGWQEVGTLGDGPCEREMHIMVAYRPPGSLSSHLLVSGGRSADGAVLQDLYTLNTGTWIWSRLLDPPAARCSHVGAYFPSQARNAVAKGSSIARQTEGQHCSGGGELWVFGGFNGTSNTISNTIMVYEIDKDEWNAPLLYPVPQERFGHSACCIDEVMYVFGGVNMSSDLSDLIAIMKG